jgi:hypothetical protein
MYGRYQRQRVEQWIDEQPELPTRKETQRQFPDAPQRVIRAALQSSKDKANIQASA